MEASSPHDFPAYLKRVEEFHGSAAPGVVIGYYIVAKARSGLPDGVLFEALCETKVCLPDAIQLLTPCTLGNGRIKIAHVGRFALTLYDKKTGEGCRAWLDAAALESWPEISDWFFKRKTKAEQDSKALLAEIMSAGGEIVKTTPVKIKEDFLRKVKLGAVVICPGCGEAFPASEGKQCGGCSGYLPYQTI